MSILAVDIGNTRIKLGLFTAPQSPRSSRTAGVSAPDATLSLPANDWHESALTDWLAQAPPQTPWWIASVNRPAMSKLQQWIDIKYPVRVIQAADLPITAAVDHPDRVGIDRLSAAVAANRLREPARGVFVIHVGTAIVVDLVSADGVFRGGAILPGIGISARALDEFTDLLPRSPLSELAAAPPALGTSTLAAIHSGLYWGAVGAMRELVARMSENLGNHSVRPEIFLTGGAAPSVAQQLDPTARYVEHLVLSGIALANPQTPAN